VLSASVHQLSATQGIGDAVICELKIVEAATHRLAQSRVIQRPVVSGWAALLDYCRSTMAHRETEQFRILYLDLKNVLIADELQAKGTIDHVPVYPREVVKRALELNAAAFILVQNHPSGDPSPSEANIMLTQQIQRAAEALGITVHDHLIIGKSAELSFRASKLL
jgi:DNA repair protein RadC